MKITTAKKIVTITILALLLAGCAAAPEQQAPDPELKDLEKQEEEMKKE